MKTFLTFLALPWLYLWLIVTTGFSAFRDNGGHTSGLASGFLLLGLIPAIVIGLVEILVLAAILCIIF